MDEKLINFIILASFVGPVGAIPYGLQVMSPVEIFIILSILYLFPLPILFKLFEFGGTHRRIYRMRIFRRVSKIANRHIDEIIELEDRITDMFKERWGHLGFYLSISLMTFLFGVFWASVISYMLMVKRKRAMLAIGAGVLMGNLFWLLLIEYFKTMITPIEIMAIVILFPLLMYGVKREMETIREIAIRLHLVKEHH